MTGNVLEGNATVGGNASAENMTEEANASSNATRRVLQDIEIDLGAKAPGGKNVSTGANATTGGAGANVSAGNASAGVAAGNASATEVNATAANQTNATAGNMTNATEANATNVSAPSNVTGGIKWLVAYDRENMTV